MGTPRPRKNDAQRLIERLLSERSCLVPDTEVWPEVLYRYTSINLRNAIQPAYDALLKLVEEVLPIDRAAVERAKQIVLRHRRLFSHDATHRAVMEQHGIEKILSFDKGFHVVPGIMRLS